VLGWSATPVPVHLGQWQDEHATTIIADAITIAQESTGHSGALHVNGQVIGSATVPTLVELSTQAQMVVVGCRGRGAFHRRVLGSVGFGLVREAHCPVAVIHDEYPAIPQRGHAPVLVGTDGSTASESATAIAFEEASRRGVQLAAMYAWCDVGAEAMPAVDWPALQTLEDKILAEHLADGSDSQH
jgi:nucleotide-binding universal stress UspA family protein